MTSTSHASTKTYVMLALMVVLGPTGNVLLSKAMKASAGLRAWTFTEVSRFFFAAMATGTVWLGIAALGLFMVCYLLVLSWADYSYISPASAVGYGVVVLFGHVLLGEQVPPSRWIGVAVICTGVLLVGGTHPVSRSGK